MMVMKPVALLVMIASLGQGLADDGLDLDKVNARLVRVRRACGDLCNASINLSVKDHHAVAPPAAGDLLSATRRAHIDCPLLLSESGIDTSWRGSGEARSAPEEIPLSLVSDFTMGGKVALKRYSNGLLNATYLEEGTGPRLIWTEKLITDQVQQARLGELKGTYGKAETQRLRRAIAAANVWGMSALVIGSENPWVEALLLEAGVANVTSLEYSEIRSEHPQLRTLTPVRFRADSHLMPYDLIVTFSSLEHPGLGRYGDSLNPWGDLIAVARGWCVAKPGAKLIIAVPTVKRDAIVWNAHREYGPLRYPHLVTNWKLIWAEGRGYQPPRIYARLPNAPRIHTYS